MGPSKKKLRNIRQQEKRVSPKAKEKAKKAQRIAQGQQHKELKRKGAEAAKQGSGRKSTGRPDDLLGEIDNVDDLFAKICQEDSEEEDPVVKGSARPEPDSDAESASSAGAFERPDGDGSDSGGEGDIAEEDEDDVFDEARHEEELRKIKKLDPAFYKFLVEQDQALLSFRAAEKKAPKRKGVADDDDDDGQDEVEDPNAPEAEDSDDEEDGEGEDKGDGEGGTREACVLSSERFKRICESAETSFTAAKAAVNAFHVAVGSIERTHKSKGKDKEGGDEKPEPRRPAKLLRVEDESTFSQILEWCIPNVLPLLRHHAGELQKKRFGKDKNWNAKVQAPSGTGEGVERPGGAVDVVRYSRFKRVQILSVIYWEEVLTLLNNLKGHDMLEFVLRHVSTPEALSWLWPFHKVRRRILWRCCSLWSTSKAHSVRVLAFLFVRNAGAMTMHLPTTPPGYTGKPPLEELIKSTIRSFVDVAARGYSWRSLGTFRFMENCMLELFRLEDATAYRLGYACIRQLALILRNSCLAAGSIPGAAKDKKNHSEGKKLKGKKAIALKEQQVAAVTSWPFVRSLYLWSKAVGSVKSLKPLAYPLSMIIIGAVKSKLTSMQHFPFVYHCLHCLNRLASSCEAFVPISSHLLKVLSVLVQAMEKAHKKRGKPSDGPQTLSATKIPELEVLLRFGQTQGSEPLVLEAIGTGIMSLFTDHLGLLSRSPAFPEITVPVFLHLRRYRKHCPSEVLRRQLKTLLDAAEATVEDIRARREGLTDVPNWKRFFVFEADSAMAKARTALYQRLAAEEKSKVDAVFDEKKQAQERQKRRLGDAEAAPEEPGEEGLSKKALKRRRQKEAKKEKEEGQKAKEAERAKRTNVDEAVVHPEAVDRDVVEEMDFLSGAED